MLIWKENNCLLNDTHAVSHFNLKSTKNESNFNKESYYTYTHENWLTIETQLSLIVWIAIKSCKKSKSVDHINVLQGFLFTSAIYTVINNQISDLNGPYVYRICSGDLLQKIFLKDNWTFVTHVCWYVSWIIIIIE